MIEGREYSRFAPNPRSIYSSCVSVWVSISVQLHRDMLKEAYCNPIKLNVRRIMRTGSVEPFIEGAPAHSDFVLIISWLCNLQWLDG